MVAAPVLVWFRQDLRLQDNPALAQALATGAPVIPVFVLDWEGEGEWRPGGAGRWWLHHSLQSLDHDLRTHDLRLILRRGPSKESLLDLLKDTGAGAVYWNRRYEPEVIDRDTAVKKALLDGNVDARSFNGSLLFLPQQIENKAGRPFQVFTPFWKHCLTQPVRSLSESSGNRWPSPQQWPESDEISDWDLLPRVAWDGGLRQTWQPGEAGARKNLQVFLEKVANYVDSRNLPAEQGTSRLSPHLHWGEISPVQVWHAVRKASSSRGGDVFLSEIGWREFAYHLLFHYPHTTREPLRTEFSNFPWRKDARRLKAWQKGNTGYPIVDAGMRELYTTGWMHNRVRMIVASFLVKHLLLPWQEGAEWFWDTLVDADLSSNTLGWQWSAGCGADAAPYFRIFNPILQGEKFDPGGTYVRRWIPELEQLPAKYIHRPWEAPAPVLEKAGVRLGEIYPQPLVDHSEARTNALAAFASLKR